MLYLFRIKKLIKLILQEYESVTEEDARRTEEYYHFPRQSLIQKRFKNYDSKKFSYILAIAESEGYIKVIKYPGHSTISSNLSISPTIAVTKSGIKLLTQTAFINLVVSSFSPVLSILLAIAACIISIIALIKN
jgi:hypothetical protein